MFGHGDTQIGTLKLRGVGETLQPHRSVLFRRMSFLLNTVDLNPPGIPPSGILIVRSMPDPLPGKVNPRGRALRLETAWENAARRALKEKYHAASRPEYGRFPPHADAVFFEDESQLLAVLLLDIVNGDAPNRWWWKIILEKSGYTSNLVKHLCEKIAVLPAVLSHLTAWGVAARVISKLSENDSLTVTAALAREFQMETAAAPLLHPGKAAGTGKRDEKNEKGDRPLIEKNGKRGQATNRGYEKDAKGGRPHPEHPGYPGPPPAPWSRWLPLNRFPAHLALPQTALVGLGLSLFYAPAKVRTPAFAREFHQWWDFHVQQEEKQTPTADGGKLGVGIHDGAPSPGDDEKMARNSTLGADGAGSAIPLPIPTAPEQRGRELAPPVPTRERDMGPKEIEKIGRRIRFDVDPAKPRTTGLPGPDRAKPPATATPSTPREIKKTVLYFPEEGVDTRLAGVFYLVNLMEYLDLPACFEEQCQLESRVGAWGTLELLARALLDNRYPEIESDPLWEALAHLDNREKGTLPGGDFYYTGDYTLPGIWREKLQITRNKAAVRHPFNLSGLNPYLEKWVSFVLPYIRDYLRRLVKPPEGEETDIIEILLFGNARLYVTAAHVDIVMGLGDISLPVRLAGLDRDPGWKPRFARVFLFHFN